jgi:hypothetical protein
MASSSEEGQDPHRDVESVMMIHNYWNQSDYTAGWRMNSNKISLLFSIIDNFQITARSPVP